MFFNKEEAIRSLSMIHDDARSVQVHKLSATTLLYDCKGLVDWLKKMGKEVVNPKVSLGSLNLKIWRCKLGQGKWHFGWTASDAILTAYDAYFKEG